MQDLSDEVPDEPVPLRSIMPRAYHLRTRPYEVCLIMMDYVPILSFVPFEIDRVELEMLDNGVLVAFKIPSFDIFQ